MLGRLVAQFQFLFEFFEADPGLFEEHEEMVEQVSGFVGEAGAVAIDGFDDRLGAFLSDFLGNGFHAFDEEAGGVGTLRHLLFPLCDESGETAHEPLFGGRVKAGSGASVAGWSDGRRLNEERVGVAIDIEVFHQEPMTGGFAFCPETLTRATEEGDASFRHGLFVGGTVHVAKHEDAQRDGVLYDNGQQTVSTFFETEGIKRRSVGNGHKGSKGQRVKGSKSQKEAYPNPSL